MMVIALGFLPLLIAPLIPYKVTGIMLFTILSSSAFVTLLVLPAILNFANHSFFKKVAKKDCLKTCKPKKASSFCCMMLILLKIL